MNNFTKLIAFLSAAFFLQNSFAGKFEETCKKIDGRVSEASSITCRSVGKTVTASVHKDHNGEIFVAAYVDSPTLNDEAIAYIEKLSSGMNVVLPGDFFQSVRDRKPGERVGFQYENMYVYWRSMPAAGAIKTSGFAIYEKNGEPPENSIRCYAAGCEWLPVSKWYGPVKDHKNTGQKKK